MRAVIQRHPKQPLTVTDNVLDIDPTALGAREMIISVRAAGVNRADLLQSAGLYPPAPGVSSILGLEVSGIVEYCGSSVTNYTIGDAVVALVSGGGYATKVVADERCVLPLPSHLSHIQGAAVMEASATVCLNLIDIAEFKSGERVFIHGGTSGIGCMALQLASQLGASWLGTTVGSETKQAAASMMGANLTVNHTCEDFVQYVLDQGSGVLDGVDIVIDIVGAPYVMKNFAILRDGGRLIQLACMGGVRCEDFSIADLLLKRIRWIGSTLRNISIEHKAKVIERVHKTVWPHLETGTIRMPIHAVFPFSQVNAAHALMKSSAHIGKIVLTSGEPSVNDVNDVKSLS